jgi:hypothetical protein
MEILKHIDTVNEVLVAAGAALFAIAVVVRLLQRLAKLTPTPKDDEILDVVGDALENTADDVKKVRVK